MFHRFFPGQDVRGWPKTFGEPVGPCLKIDHRKNGIYRKNYKRNFNFILRTGDFEKKLSEKQKFGWKTKRWVYSTKRTTQPDFSIPCFLWNNQKTQKTSGVENRKVLFVLLSIVISLVSEGPTSLVTEFWIMWVTGKEKLEKRIVLHFGCSPQTNMISILFSLTLFLTVLAQSRININAPPIFVEGESLVEYKQTEFPVLDVALGGYNSVVLTSMFFSLEK